jgi:uncharacterized protein YjbJ (UPF0337 family)
MSTLVIKGNWHIFKGWLKQKWGKLTDNDLRFIEGKEEELVGRIQKRSAGAKAKVRETIDKACDTLCPPHQ